MRFWFIVLILFFSICGCSDLRNPIDPHQNTLSPNPRLKYSQSFHDPHTLWGEWELHFNDAHSEITLVPRRNARFHLNTVKFMEEDCTNCLEITGLQNNGDQTIDLTLRITHPFSMHPEYTGFDVKGIIMFNGSHLLKWGSYFTHPIGEQIRISWRELGDPEVLNADGYTGRWCPTWDTPFEPDSELPMFNYWPGKHTMGSPTANLNAYLDFYTDEERHMFRVNNSVERTYHLWLPPGPVAAGYAVDACWEPPLVTPVTDPVADFPISANQPEPFVAKVIVNNNEIILDPDCCGYFDDCTNMYVETSVWYDEEAGYMTTTLYPDHGILGLPLYDCMPSTAPEEGLQTPGGIGFASELPDGLHRGASYIRRMTSSGLYMFGTWDVFDFEIDLPD